MVEYQVTYSPERKTIVTRVTSCELLNIRKKQYSHSVGHWSSSIMSGMDSSLPLPMVSLSLLGSNCLFLPGLGGLGPFSLFPANQFQEALDPGSCLLPCQAQCISMIAERVISPQIFKLQSFHKTSSPGSYFTL
jgi:hypothetical protein